MTMSETPRATAINAPPPHLTSTEYEQATSSTPQSFADIPPRLVVQLENVTVQAQPALAGVANGKGTLWVTEGSLSFLSDDQSGFSLPYPLLALHAVSSSVPSPLASSSTTQGIYCQIDDAAGADGEQDGGVNEDDEDEGSGFRELWIVPASSEDVEPLFSALSHCASLHPSIQDADGEDAGGNPFAGMGPFGTGEAIHDAAQFDDADEHANGSNGLSETGRQQLARLDALLDADDSDAEEEEAEQPVRPSSPVEASPPPIPSSFSASSSNVIMVSSSPIAVPSLFSPPLLQSLLALLDAYLPVVGWDPIASEGKMRVVFNDQIQGDRSAARGGGGGPGGGGGKRSRRSSFSRPPGAPTAPAPTSNGVQRIIETLNGLPLETEESNPSLRPTLHIAPLGWMDITRLMPASLSSSAVPGLAKYKPTDHLLPPASDRNFLISPPGSPPIGWEPIIEDPPNRETLAGDLMEALKRLGKEMCEGDEEEEEDVADDVRVEDENDDFPPGTVHLVIPPSQGDTPAPAVTVQSFDDGQQSNKDGDGSKSPRDITQVKATVESMRGAGLSSAAPSLAMPPGGESDVGGGGGKRITPTGRPPLV